MPLFENTNKKNEVQVSGLLNTILNDVVINNHGVPLEKFEQIWIKLIEREKDYESQKKAVEQWVAKYVELEKRFELLTNDELEIAAKEQLELGNLDEAERLYEQLFDKNDKELDFLERLIQKKKIEQSERSITLAMIKELQFKFEEAVFFLRKSLKYVSANPHALEKLGENLFALGRYQESAEAYSLSVKYYKKEKSHYKVIIVNMHIADCQRRLGDLSQSEKLINQALSVADFFYTDDSLEIGIIYDASGILFQDIGKYFEAEKVQLLAKEIFEGQENKDPLRLAVLYNNLGQSYRYLGKFGVALEYLEKSLAIKRGFLGNYHPSIAITLDNIGNVYYYEHNFDKSIEIHNEAILIREQVLPKNHPDLGFSYDNLVLPIKGLKNYTDALKYQLKAIEIIENSIAKNHHEAAITYNSLGTTYYYLGKFDQAIDEYKKALKIRLTNFGEINPRVGNSYANIGWAFYRMNKLEEALSYLKIASKIFEKTLPKENFEFVQTIEGIKNIEDEITNTSLSEK